MCTLKGFSAQDWPNTLKRIYNNLVAGDELQQLFICSFRLLVRIMEAESKHMDFI